jgi:hypothetical protein
VIDGRDVRPHPAFPMVRDNKREIEWIKTPAR